MNPIDDCPGVLDLHQGTDGAVARLRIPGGLLDAALMNGLADLCIDVGSGFVDLTSRGNVQIRGISDHDELVRRCSALGLLPSPAHDRARNITMSPLSSLSGWVRRLDAAICASPVLGSLTGRFLFALDDGMGGSGLGSSDVGALVSARDAELVIKGHWTGVSVSLDELIEQMCLAASDFSLELGSRVEMPEQRLTLGAHGSFFVAAARLSRISVEQLRGLATLVPEVRIASAGRLALVDGALLGEQAAQLGLLVDDGDPMSTVTACSGLGCVRAEVDVRALARPVGSAVHWVGCERNCGLPVDAVALQAS